MRYQSFSIKHGEHEEGARLLRHTVVVFKSTDFRREYCENLGEFTQYIKHYGHSMQFNQVPTLFDRIFLFAVFESVTAVV